ncbi:hypothetical protein FACS189441_1070 [Betaproteobacteria bacterium]|nr:hypothetical protein FACS189441_1070 [Betaproteobacteria bacterium]
MTKSISTKNNGQTAEKQNFTNKTNQQIEVYANLLAALEICEQCIRQFDKKVVNIRLINAIKKENTLKKLAFSLEYDKYNDCQRIQIGDYQNRTFERTIPYGCRDVDEYKIEIRLITPSQRRIDAKETIDLMLTDAKEYLKNQKALCENDLLQYDEEQLAWAELKKQVGIYSAKFSYRLQGEISMKRK